MLQMMKPGTMEMTTRRGILPALFFLVLILLSHAGLRAQVNDFRTWSELDLRKDIGKDLQLSLEIGQRFKENSLRYDRTLFTGEIQWDITGSLELSGGARYYIVSNSELDVVSRYRLNTDLSWEHKIGSFSAGIRQRIQYGFDDIATIDDYTGNNLKSRSRLQAGYHIFGTPLTLEASYEMFLGIFRNDGVYPVEHRLKAGSGIVLSQRAELEIAYLMESEVNVVAPVRAHILVLGIKYIL